MDWKVLLNKERRRQSTVPGDARTEFERDFDRAVFSTPVRRLQDKTQVFPLESHDAIRNRLTHSLEVSSVARGIATGVTKWLLREGIIEPGMDRSIEAIAATCGLIHDLGNPPFGHTGEDAIRSWFTDRFGTDRLVELLRDEQLVQDFLKFEGNAQSLRLLGKLQILVDLNGLNFTFGTLSASCKYTAPSHVADRRASNHSMRKPGYFASENELVERMRRETGTGTARNPITYLVEAADDIVYAAGDIEDGVKKGILSWDRLKMQLTEGGKGVYEEVLERVEKILRAGASEAPPQLPDDVYASALRTASIGILVPSIVEAFKGNYAAIMAGVYPGGLAADCSASPLCQLLVRIGRERVYSTHSTLKLEIMGREVIGDLLGVFWEGAEALPLNGPPNTAQYSGKIGALLSENYRRVFLETIRAGSPLPEAYHRLQLVTDYICGMTDSFAKRLHAELRNGT